MNKTDLSLNFNGVNSNKPNYTNVTDLDNESNRTPTMTVENESVFNSQTSPATPNPTNRLGRRTNTPYTSTGTRKRSTRKSLNFVRKKKVGGKLVEIGTTKDKEISDLIDKIIIQNTQIDKKSAINSKMETATPDQEIREIEDTIPKHENAQIQNEATKQAEKI